MKKLNVNNNELYYFHLLLDIFSLLKRYFPNFLFMLIHGKFQHEISSYTLHNESFERAANLGLKHAVNPAFQNERFSP